MAGFLMVYKTFFAICINGLFIYIYDIYISISKYIHLTIELFGLRNVNNLPAVSHKIVALLSLCVFQVLKIL